MRVTQNSSSQSYISKFVSPSRANTIIPQKEAPAPIRETIHTLKDSVIPQQREQVVALPAQVVFTKKAETRDFSDYEVKIQSLIHEVELWRKRYQELVIQHDKCTALQEMITQLEQRITIFTQESVILVKETKDKITENDKLKAFIQSMELELCEKQSLAQENKRLIDLLNLRQGEFEELRHKYNELDSKFIQFKTMEITLAEYEGQIKGLTSELEMWKKSYEKADDERNAYIEQFRAAEADVIMYSMDSAKRSLILKIQVYEKETERLNLQNDSLVDECDGWRRKALQFQSDLELANNSVSDLTKKNSLFQSEVDRLNTVIVAKNRDIDKYRGECSQLSEKLGDIDALTVANSNLNQVIANQQKSTEDLRKQIAKLDNQIGELKHEMILKIELEAEMKRLKEEVEKQTTLSKQRMGDIDQWKIKFGQLENRNSELMQQLATADQLEQQLQQAVRDKQNLDQRMQNKEAQINEFLKQINEQNQRIAQLKLMEVDVLRLQDELEGKKRDIGELRSRITKLEMRSQQGKNIEEKAFELQKQLQLMGSSFDQTKQQLYLKQQELDKIYVDNQKLDYKNSQLLFLEEDVGSLRSQLDAANENAQQWQVKHDKVVQELQSVQQMMSQMQGQNDYLMNDLKRVQKLVDDRKQEVSDWKARAARAEQETASSKKYLSQMEVDIKQLQTDNEKLTKEKQELKLAFEDARARLAKAENDLRAAQFQFKSQYLTLQQKLDELTAQLRQKNAETDEWKKRYLKAEQLAHDLSTIEEKYQAADYRVTSLTRENQKLNEQLKQRTDILENVRQKLSSTEIKVQSLQLVEKENQKLKELLEDKSKQLVQVQVRIPSLENDCNELKRQLDLQFNRNNKIQSETQRINELYQQKVNESEQLRNKNNIYETSLQNLRYTEKRLPELEARISGQNSEIAKLTKQVRESNYDVEKANQQIAKLEVQVSNYLDLQKDYARLKNQHQSRQQELDREKMRANKLEMELNSLNIIRQDLERKNVNIESENDRIMKQLQQRNKEFEQIQKNYQRAQVLVKESQKNAERAQQLDQKLNTQILENQNANELRRNAEEEVSKLVAKVNQLTILLNTSLPCKNEVEILRDQVDQDQEQFAEWKKRYFEVVEMRERETAEAQRIINGLEAELNQQKALNARLPELENALGMQEAELRKLVQQLQATIDERDLLKFKYQSLELRIKQFEEMEKQYKHFRELSDQQQFRIYNKQQIRINTIEDLKFKLDKKIAEAQEFRNFKEALEQRVALLASEIERQSRMVQVKNDQLETLNQSIQRLEQIVGELGPLEGDNRRLNETQQELRVEIQQWKDRAAKSEDQAKEAYDQKTSLENRLALLSSEIERLKVKADNRLANNEQLQAQVQELQQENSDLRRLEGIRLELEEKSNKVTDDNNKLSNELAQKNREIAELKNEINNMSIQIQQVKQMELELQKLSLAVQAKEKEIEEWKAKIDGLLKKIEQLEQIKFDYEGKIAMLSSEIERQNKKYQTCQLETQNSKDQIALLYGELERLNQHLNNLGQENNELRQKLNQLATQNTSRVIETVVKTTNRS